MQPDEAIDVQQWMQQAQTVRQQLVTAQAALTEEELTGTAGNGLVTVTMRGDGAVVSVRVDPTVVDPHQVHALEDLVRTAVGNAVDAVRAAADEKIAVVTAGLQDIHEAARGPHW